MQKLFIFLLTCFIIHSGYAQKYKHGVSIQYGAFDFYGPIAGKYGYHAEKNIKSGKKAKVLLWDPAIQINYWRAFSKRIDVKLAAWRSKLQYPEFASDSIYLKAKRGDDKHINRLPYYVLDAKIIYSIVPKDKFIISPYVTTGFSASMRNKVLGFDVPSGIGLNIHVWKRLYVNVESNYRYVATIETQDHLSHSAGIVYCFKGKPKKIIPVRVKTTAPVDTLPQYNLNYDLPQEAADMRDTDKDGVPNAIDQCPYHAGKKENNGCPDKDEDGVYDFEDNCPELKGTAELGGCPDTDGDGIVDIEDKCPLEAGLASSNGCIKLPIEIIEKIKSAALGIKFDDGKYEPNISSNIYLDSIANILLSDNTIDLNIICHTDNRGKVGDNLGISQQRAEACKSYLVNKGISAKRISSFGYGDTRPIADNNTEEGRVLNRRTEINAKR